MATDPLAGLAASGGTQQSLSKSEQSRNQLAEDMDQFMTLLTTQLQNQDPLEPMKTEEFTQQLVQFAGVEQQINMNASLEQLIALQGSMENSTAVSYLGKTVATENNKVPLQDGSASFQYTLPQETANTSILIRNPNGVLVRTLEGDVNAGTHKVDWDGQDQYGNPLADGTYTVEVAATSQDGEFLEGAVIARGVVDGITFEDGSATLTMGGISVPLDQVLGVTTSDGTVPLEDEETT